jgi:hypothetical protein
VRAAESGEAARGRAVYLKESSSGDLVPDQVCGLTCLRLFAFPRFRFFFLFCPRCPRQVGQKHSAMFLVVYVSAVGGRPNLARTGHDFRV